MAEGVSGSACERDEVFEALRTLESAGGCGVPLESAQQLAGEVGRRIGVERGLAGLTITALAELLRGQPGVTARRATVSEWERGLRMPSLWSLLALARVLEVPLWRLVPLDGLQHPVPPVDAAAARSAARAAGAGAGGRAPASSGWVLRCGWLAWSAVGRCPATFQAGGASGEELRCVAAASGWTFEREYGDVCPEHSAVLATARDAHLSG